LTPASSERRKQPPFEIKEPYTINVHFLIENIVEDFRNQYNCLDCENCFDLSLFNFLSGDELKVINESRLEVNFKKGEIIYKQGTPITHLVIIHDGLGKTYIEGPNGRNLILIYTRNTDLNGGVGLFLDQRHHSSLMAVTDCETCFIDVNSFRSVYRNNTAFLEDYLRGQSQRNLHILNQFLLLTHKNMEGRMAETLIYMSDNFFNKGPIINIPKQDFAELTAMSKESTIRVLKEFKDDGLIKMAKHYIEIVDREALKSIANHG